MRIGAYDVVAEIGRGGAGAVYRARSPDGREVAIKVLLAARSEDARRRFERERRLAATLGADAGFVPLLDAGEVRGVPYIVMPFVTGGTLRRRLENGALSPDEVHALGVALATGLARAHERGIVHRDLKPENVLFDAERRPLIADLGLAKHFRDDVSGASQSVVLSLETPTFRGTAGYLAPEQARDASTVGAAADVFALGAILYECASGVPAFSGEGPIELLAKLMEGQREPLRRVAPRVRPALEAVIERALSIDPAARYPDAVALARALVAAGPGRRRSRSLAVVALAVLVGLGLAAGAAWARSARVESRRAEARELVAKGLALTDAGRLAEAIVALSRAVELDPGSALAWCLRGDARCMALEYEDGLRDLEHALALDPRLAVAYQDRGCALAHRGDLDGALRDLARAVELDPKLAIAWFNLGATLATRRRFDEGLAALERSLELAPRRAGWWAELGFARFLAGRDSALAALDRAVALDGADARVRLRRAMVRARSRNFADAEVDLTVAIERDPSQGNAWAERAEVRWCLRNLDGALDDAERALSIPASAPRGLLTRAFVREARGDLAGAVEDLERALALRLDGEHAAVARARLERLRAR